MNWAVSSWNDIPARWCIDGAMMSLVWLPTNSVWMPINSMWMPINSMPATIRILIRIIIVCSRAIFFSSNSSVSSAYFKLLCQSFFFQIQLSLCKTLFGKLPAPLRHLFNLIKDRIWFQLDIICSILLDTVFVYFNCDRFIWWHVTKINVAHFVCPLVDSPRQGILVYKTGQ